ncbi:MAG: phage portal protein [Dehalococcoidia bacterium]|nr:phage portal protein [Dehalococcoidia bacterium]
MAQNALTLPQQIARMNLGRLRGYGELLAFYQGDQWPGPLRRRERRLIFNYAKAFVEKTTSYLMSGMHSVVDAEDESPDAAERARRAEVALQEVSEQNNLAQLDFDTEIDAAVLGDGAFKVTWDPIERRVRVSAPDAQGLFVWWLGDDMSRLWRVASRYYMSADEVEIAFGVRPSERRSGRGGRIEVVEVWTAQTFGLWIAGAPAEEKANPYGFIPFIIYPNLREPKQFWGTSDIPAIRESVRELNRALSQLSMILELSGNPIAVLENVRESQDIAVQPGAVWELPDRARAYLLDLLQGGGVQLHVDYVQLLYRTMHDLGEAPRTAFGESRANLSGVALNLELDPLLKKVQRKRLIRTAAYQRRNEMILRILEQATGVPLRQRSGQGDAPYRSRIIWGPVVPRDRSRLVTDEGALVAAGIHSRRRAADELGVADPDAEFSRWLEEQERLGAQQAAIAREGGASENGRAAVGREGG